VGLEFFEHGFSFTYADRYLMTASAMIDDASCNYENSRLVGNYRGERVDLEEVVCVFSSE